MKIHRLDNVNIVSEAPITPPGILKKRLRPSAAGMETIYKTRRSIRRILQRKEKRLLVIVGPCSIHDCEAALDYAHRLAALAREVENELLLVMRVYFEKPRSGLGWKGLISDPHLDGSWRIEDGLWLARSLLVELAEMGVPAATEALDPLTPQYISDLISWYSIGARTAESQPHRQLASGLSAPVGFKNARDGTIQSAILGVQMAAKPHRFLGLTAEGRSALFETRGNRFCHVVLRGGEQPNYAPRSIARCEQALRKARLPLNILVDCSHGNSGKQAQRQPTVFRSVLHQVLSRHHAIIGMMLESNLFFGRQELGSRRKQLRYGVSITDECLDWETTARLIHEASRKQKSQKG